MGGARWDATEMRWVCVRRARAHGAEQSGHRHASASSGALVVPLQLLLHRQLCACDSALQHRCRVVQRRQLSVQRRHRLGVLLLQRRHRLRVLLLQRCRRNTSVSQLLLQGSSFLCLAQGRQGSPKAHAGKAASSRMPAVSTLPRPPQA